jgi:hypothetical protein
LKQKKLGGEDLPKGVPKKMVLEGEKGSLVKVAAGNLERGKEQTDKTALKAINAHYSFFSQLSLAEDLAICLALFLFLLECLIRCVSFCLSYVVCL